MTKVSRRKTLSHNEIEEFLSGITNKNSNKVDTNHGFSVEFSEYDVDLTKESLSDEESIRKYCQMIFTNNNNEITSRKIASTILRNTNYRLLPSRFVQPELFPNPPESIESKKQLLLSLTPMLSDAEKQRSFDVSSCETFTRCRSIKGKGKYAPYEYLDFDINNVIDYIDYEKSTKPHKQPPPQLSKSQSTSHVNTVDNVLQEVNLNSKSRISTDATNKLVSPLSNTKKSSTSTTKAVKLPSSPDPKTFFTELLNRPISTSATTTTVQVTNTAEKIANIDSLVINISSSTIVNTELAALNTSTETPVNNVSTRRKSKSRIPVAQPRRVTLSPNAARNMMFDALAAEDAQDETSMNDTNCSNQSTTFSTQIVEKVAPELDSNTLHAVLDNLLETSSLDTSAISMTESVSSPVATEASTISKSVSPLLVFSPELADHVVPHRLSCNFSYNLLDFETDHLPPTPPSQQPQEQEQYAIVEDVKAELLDSNKENVNYQTIASVSTNTTSEVSQEEYGNTLPTAVTASIATTSSIVQLSCVTTPEKLLSSVFSTSNTTPSSTPTMTTTMTTVKMTPPLSSKNCIEDIFDIESQQIVDVSVNGSGNTNTDWDVTQQKQLAYDRLRWNIEIARNKFYFEMALIQLVKIVKMSA